MRHFLCRHCNEERKKSRTNAYKNVVGVCSFNFPYFYICSCLCTFSTVNWIHEIIHKTSEQIKCFTNSVIGQKQFSSNEQKRMEKGECGIICWTTTKQRPQTYFSYSPVSSTSIFHKYIWFHIRTKHMVENSTRSRYIYTWIWKKKYWTGTHLPLTANITMKYSLRLNWFSSIV